jgi:ornithine carbamoyltransferase
MHEFAFLPDEAISAKKFEGAKSLVFQQIENRLHVQKALLLHLLAPEPF